VNGDSGDFAPDTRAVANIGKRFYTWATLGTFAGAAFLVGSLWQILRSVGGSVFEHLAWPLVLSVLVLTVFAFATEPGSQHTKRHQKVQKGLITLANALLVYFAVVGGSALLTK
jgi:hypothetical protein